MHSEVSDFTNLEYTYLTNTSSLGYLNIKLILLVKICI